jgi:hypothetical protein
MNEVGCLKGVLNEWLTVKDIVQMVTDYYWLPYHVNPWLLRALKHYFVSEHVMLSPDLNLRVGRAHLVLTASGGCYREYLSPLPLAIFGLSDAYLHSLWTTPNGYFQAEQKRVRLRFRKRNASNRYGKRHGVARKSRLVLSGLEIQKVPTHTLQSILDNEQQIEKWCQSLYHIHTRKDGDICFFLPFSPTYRYLRSHYTQKEQYKNRPTF